MTIYGPHHIVTLTVQRYMIYFMDEYSSFGTISFVEKFIEVRQIVDDYIAKAKRQRDDQMNLLKVEIEDEFMKDIHYLITPSLEVVSIALVFSSISQTSRVGAAERYYTRLMSMVNLMYLKTFLPRSFRDYVAITYFYILNHTTNSSVLKTLFRALDGIQRESGAFICLGL